MSAKSVCQTQYRTTKIFYREQLSVLGALSMFAGAPAHKGKRHLYPQLNYFKKIFILVSLPPSRVLLLLPHHFFFFFLTEAFGLLPHPSPHLTCVLLPFSLGQSQKSFTHRRHHPHRICSPRERRHRLLRWHFVLRPRRRGC